MPRLATPILTVPPHIEVTGLVGAEPTFPWDESGTKAYWDRTSDQLHAQIVRLSPNARFALSTGLLEWILWRFDGLHDYEGCRDYVRAGWAGVADSRYLLDWALPKDRKLHGPVLRSLWIGCFLLHRFNQTNKRKSPPSDWVMALSFYVQHVYEGHEAYKSWLIDIFDRLAELSPLPPGTRAYYADTSYDPDEVDAFEWGVALPREVMDTSVAYDRDTTAARIDAYLRALADAGDPETNPFLASREALRGAGFVGEPYTYDPLAER